MKQLSACGTVGVVLLAALSSCGGGVPNFGPTHGSLAHPASALVLGCGSSSSTSRVLTPVVQAQPDGVRVEVRNSALASLFVGEVSALAPPGVSKYLVPFPPSGGGSRLRRVRLHR